MANINIQQAPDVVLEEPGSVFKGLAGTVLQGVISDIFYQAKQDRRTQQASLWEGYKLHGELGVKLADPILVEEGIAKIDLKLSDARTSNADKQQLSVLRDSFELQLKDLKKKEPTKDVASSVAGFQDLFNNAKGGGSPEFIGDAINDMQHEYDRLIDEHIPERMGDVADVTESLEAMRDNEWAEFANKYYQTSLDLQTGEQISTNELRDDLTNQELIQLGLDQEILSAKSKGLQEEAKIAVEASQLDPEAYLREVRQKPGDRELATSLDILSGQIRILEEEKNKSESIRNWNIAINEYEKVLMDGKKNPEGFGELSKALFDDLTEIAQTNSYHLQSTHFKMLDDLQKDAKGIITSLNILDRVGLIQDSGGDTDEVAQDHLRQAFDEATRAYTTGDTGAVSKAVSSINSAINAEGRYKIRVAKGIESDKKTETKRVKGLLGIEASKIAESFGKGAKGAESKKVFDSDYLGGGSYSVNQNPEGFLKGLNIDTPQNLNASKAAVGENVAKLVLSSDLEGVQDKAKAKQLANQALNTNLSNELQAKALDELFSKHLQDADTDLDFEGIGKRDTSAKNLYSQYLRMYEVLHTFGIESSSKWGKDFGAQFISEYGHGSAAIDSLTGEDYGGLFD